MKYLSLFSFLLLFQCSPKNQSEDSQAIEAVAPIEQTPPTKYPDVLTANDSVPFLNGVMGTLSKQKQSYLIAIDMPAQIGEELKQEYWRKAVVMFVCRAFIHTDAEELQFTVTQNAKRETFKVKKQHALQVLNNLMGLQSFDQLVGVNMEGVWFNNMNNDHFMRITYTSQGEPGLDRFYEALTAQ